ncbi:hypothetical protein [Neolewinella persica]|uniref:hypothetical protein n=1 Tax=Neolewinella persica TaxID=70998 RepID=UPI0003711F4B|nr:hypothetical protein [Neolewinella persica]
MPKVKYILRFATVTACLGLGLRALFSDLPIRALVWDEQWWGWCASLVGMSWKEWVTSASVDAGIETVKLIIGIVMIVIAGLVITVERDTKVIKTALWIAFVILLIQNFLNWKEHFWQIGQLLELSLLTATPLLYMKYGGGRGLTRFEQTKEDSYLPYGTLRSWLSRLRRPAEVQGGRTSENAARFSPMPPQHSGPEIGIGHSTIDSFGSVEAVRVTTCLVALTFIGHGFYAAGVHPVPASFVMMTQASLGVGEGVARNLLFSAGLLDFMAAALLLIPRNKAMLIALCWIIPWAILTTLARWWSYQGIVEWNTLLTQWLPEVIIRLPHVLVPLVLWRWVRK